MIQTERGNKIGIVGGGQLGRMLVEAGTPMGFEFTVVDPTPNSPAAQRGAKQILGSITDAFATRILAMQSNVTTIEIEHVNAEALLELSLEGHNIQPSPETLLTVIDKLTQKDMLSSLGIPVAPYRGFDSFDEALEVAREFGPGFFVKVRQGGFDGRGNMQIQTRSDLEEAFKRFEGKHLYAEKRIDFEREIAILIARSKTGEVITYPVVQTFQDDGICDEVVATKEGIGNKIEAQAADYATILGKNLKGAGVFAVEAFVTKDGDVIFNEIAPRVHNSYHLSTESHQTSQFEQHLLAVSGRMLGDPAFISEASAMKNLLTGLNPQGIEEASDLPGVSIHLYGKEPRLPARRKVGHITAEAKTAEEALKNVRAAHALISS